MKRDWEEAWDDIKKAGAARFSQMLREARSVPHVMLGGVEHKSCARCGKLQALDQFWKQTGTPDGLRPSCKTCHRKSR